MTEPVKSPVPLQAVVTVMCDVLAELQMDDQARALEAVRITLGIFPRHRVGLAPENPGVRGAEDSQMELVAEFCRSLRPEQAQVLVAEFCRSLRPEQAQVLTQTLDMAQKIMFMEIVNFLRSPT
jgi:hypothetical protein